MKTYRITMLIEVDEEILAAHDGDVKPPPNRIQDWYGGDVQMAFDEGIAEPVHDELELIELVRQEVSPS